MQQQQQQQQTGGFAAAQAFVKTAHFEERQARRQVRDAEIAFTLRYGIRVYDRGDIVYFLGRRCIPAGLLDAQTARRIEGTVVVLGHDNALITTYRNPRYLRHQRRRQQKRRWGGGRQSPWTEPKN